MIRSCGGLGYAIKTKHLQDVSYALELIINSQHDTYKFIGSIDCTGFTFLFMYALNTYVKQLCKHIFLLNDKKILVLTQSDLKIKTSLC